MHSRAHIEEKIVNRLTKSKPGDREVSAYEFKLIVDQLSDDVFKKVLFNTSIPGFTDDDLVSFMLMKTHQMLKRDKYDFDRKPQAVFYTAFTNLMRDIIRMQNLAHGRGMYLDTIDWVEKFHLEEQLLSHEVHTEYSEVTFVVNV